jgi:hypothetical protein
MRIEVRCCCQPTKLLGWMDVSRHVKEGDVLTFPLATRAAAAASGLSQMPESVTVEQLRLPVAVFQDVVLIGRGGDDVEEVRTMHLAIKSEETPIETLRRIPQFDEATP